MFLMLIIAKIAKIFSAGLRPAENLCGAPPRTPLGLPPQTPLKGRINIPTSP